MIPRSRFRFPPKCFFLAEASRGSLWPPVASHVPLVAVQLYSGWRGWERRHTRLRERTPPTAATVRLCPMVSVPPPDT